MKEVFSNSKIYINAGHQSIVLQYLTFIVLFAIVPLSLLFLYIKALKLFFSFQITHPVILLISFALCFLFILLLLPFIYWRKYWVIKIVTTDTEIISHGFLKKVHSRWEDIISIESPSTVLGKNQAEVKTKNGKFFFPFTMKEKNKNYPKLVMSWDWQWQYENGNKEATSLGNCPLYIEIQKHL